MRQSDKQKFRELIVLLCAIAASVIFASCKTVIPDPINPFPTTTTTTQPETASLYPAKVHTSAGWVNWSDLTANCTITDFNISPSRFRAAYTGHENWKSADGLTCGFIVMIWEYDGVMQGEYWDGMSKASPYGYVSLFHITDPSSPFAGRLPVKDQKVGMLFISQDNKYRSSVAWAEWPLDNSLKYGFKYDDFWKVKK